jgi:phosphoenolpyruvate carboxykinase (GTP)
MAATMGSETTAAIAGQVGVVRRDPFAMLAFMGYHMGDHFAHWLEIGRKLAGAGATLPRIYCVNWFRKGPDGKFVWPGFGENMRVLKWMVERIEGRAGGAENAFGISPRYDDLSWDGLAFSRDQYATVIGLDKQAWSQELALHQKLFDMLGERLPKPLLDTKRRIEQRLGL